MQWQTHPDAKKKDSWEQNCSSCGASPAVPRTTARPSPEVVPAKASGGCACAKGTQLQDGTITRVRAVPGGQQDYLIIKLIGITITAVLQAEANNQAGTETVSLTFQKVDFEYRPPSPAGAPGVHFKWDVPANGPW